MIHIGKTIMNKRKALQLTQQEFADYMQVSKASVSKWESNTSYPDITMLPKIATFFQMSLDELFNVQPQMTKEEIKQLYIRLAEALNHTSFYEVYEQIKEYVVEYYTCYPLQVQLLTLVLNHYMLANEPMKILNELLHSFQRVKRECQDPFLLSQIAYLEGMIYLIKQEPEAIIQLYEKDHQYVFNTSNLLASAYLMRQEVDEASNVLEIRMFQDLLGLLQNLTTYLSAHPEKIHEIENQIRTMIALFHLDEHHPATVMTLYFQLATLYLPLHQDQALYYLELFTSLFNQDMHFTHREVFSAVDDWLEAEGFGYLPRSLQKIKESTLEAFAQPLFDGIREDHRFIACLERLQPSCN